MDVQEHEQRQRELDADGIAGLFRAVGEYHRKHSNGPGGAAICICGAGCDGSRACRGLEILCDLFRYAEWGDERWRERYEMLQRCFGR